MIREIEKRAPDKNTIIHIYRRSTDGESYSYATKIVQALMTHGYKDSAVDGLIYDPIIGGDPAEAAKQQREFGYKWEKWQGRDQLNIAIPSNQ